MRGGTFTQNSQPALAGGMMDREWTRKIAEDGDLTVKTAYAIAGPFARQRWHGASAQAA
jgi:hypothetical protein